MTDLTPTIPGAPTPDAMQRYSALLREEDSTLHERLSKFRDKEFILVRGFLTDTLNRLGLMMEDQTEVARGLGAKARKVQDGFDSENAPEVNAVAIASAVKAARSGVILVTHSKGSVDALTALVNHPDIRSNIEGWISIQGAVQGSGVADLLAGKSGSALVDAIKDEALAAVFTLFRGSIEALRGLRTKDRVEYLVDNEGEIRKIVTDIPIVAFGSAAPVSRSTLRKVTDRFFAAEPSNDGLVSVGRTVIPGARVIIHDLDGPDHADAVMAVPGQKWDRKRMTRVLLSLLP